MSPVRPHECLYCDTEITQVIVMGSKPEARRSQLTLCQACQHVYIVTPLGLNEPVAPLHVPQVVGQLQSMGATTAFCPDGHLMATSMPVRGPDGEMVDLFGGDEEEEDDEDG